MGIITYLRSITRGYLNFLVSIFSLPSFFFVQVMALFSRSWWQNFAFEFPSFLSIIELAAGWVPISFQALEVRA